MRAYYILGFTTLFGFTSLAVSQGSNSTLIDFDLAPMRPPQTPAEAEAVKSCLMRLDQAYKVTPPAEIAGRLSVFADPEVVEFTIMKEATGKDIYLLLRCSQREDRTSDKAGFFRMNVEVDLAEVFHSVCMGFLSRTSYSNGALSFNGLDGVTCELANDFMGGVCYDPPKNSVLGSFIEETMLVAVKLSSAPSEAFSNRNLLREYKDKLVEIDKLLGHKEKIIALKPLFKELEKKPEFIELSIDKTIRSIIANLGRVQPVKKK